MVSLASPNCASTHQNANKNNISGLFFIKIVSAHKHKYFHFIVIFQKMDFDVFCIVGRILNIVAMDDANYFFFLEYVLNSLSFHFIHFPLFCCVIQKRQQVFCRKQTLIFHVACRVERRINIDLATPAFKDRIAPHKEFSNIFILNYQKAFSRI